MFLLILFLIILTICTSLICIKKYKDTYNDKNFYLKKSKIHGVGVFPKIKFNKDSKLFKLVDKNNNFSKLCSKVNHCQYNKTNSYIKKIKDEWYLFALKDINIGDEIVCDYNNTPNFMRKPKKEWKC